ncbi:HXXXD-type acyl-transferase family protein [Rhynchospora pubera]|uniref:HXXXD-type acyl-transferase family protein n=1 Tax=Rhynchospora pubera TaxID=906938 RepID=A0AAV8E7I1_9POAL|nr:HXXXD-type acyl-transferase family protein [Rhynchospora pubera]
MASTPLPTKILESSRIAPLPGTTPDHASLPFTYFDIFWINLPPVERLFFYRYPHPTTHFLSSLLPSLKSSLSLALKTYYPLAGGFRQIPGTDDSLELYYVEGDAVPFTVAECSGQFDDLASYHEQDVSQLECLVPVLPRQEELQPLLAVQVTIFPGEGIVIGTSHQCIIQRVMAHPQCNLCTHGLKPCLSGSSVSSPVPIFDRSLISDPSNNYSFFYNHVQSLLKSVREGTIPALENSELVLATFTLRQEHIQRLKQLVLAKADQSKTSFHCSTIVVAFAYIWTGFVRAKRIDNSSRVSLGIAADFRARIQPPLPKEYFGNCVGFCIATANVADLVQDDGVFVAAEAVGKAIDQLIERLKVVRKWFDEYASLRGTPILSVAGSPKFKVYDVDFGLGKPSKVEIISATKTGPCQLRRAETNKEELRLALHFLRMKWITLRSISLTVLKIFLSKHAALLSSLYLLQFD